MEDVGTGAEVGRAIAEVRLVGETQGGVGVPPEQEVCFILGERL